jgi:glycerophosphoryl diester phosphodiesterase
MTRPLAVAHRGYSARYPENTLLAAERAVTAGCDLVEADARLAADGSVWCVHDADLQRLAGLAIRVAEADAAALSGAELRCGERLATLDQVLGHVAGRVPVLIDVKTTDLDTARAVLRVVGSGRVERVWFGFRSAAQVEEVRGLASGARCLGFLPAYEEAPAFAAAGAQALRVWEGHMDQPAAARLFGQGPVWVTAGGTGTGSEPGDVTPERLARIVARGAAAVLLNDPTLLAPGAAQESPP